MVGDEKKFVEMMMGAGGRAMQEFISQHLLKHFLNASQSVLVGLDDLDDSAVVGDHAFTIDGHTVKPYIFPGGDIGSLAVAGTVNDLAVIGAKPIALALGIIIEEGFPISDLNRIAKSIGETSKEAGVVVATGDTKVVGKGEAESIYITTAGIGIKHPYLIDNWESVGELRGKDHWLLDSNLREGDKIIISGTIGDHGVTILSSREGYGFETSLKSDVMPVNRIVSAALRVGGVVSAKDPTRGGVANTLNEWVDKSSVGIKIYESSLPMREGVISASEMLGIEPLDIGNEGKVIFSVIKEKAEEILEAIRKEKGGENAEIIGEVVKDYNAVVMETLLGGLRVVDSPQGDPIPRIC